MQTKTLTSGFSIPILGLGTWLVGGTMEPDFSKDQEYIDGIKRAIDLGINLIDTAEIYAAGHAEELVGKAIQGYKRSDLFITSKVYKTHLHYNDVINAAQKSLERLGTDYLDLYLIHFPNPDIDLKETMDAMNYLVDQGLVRNIGVSNFKKERLALAQSFSKAKIVLNQCHYNLMYREPELTGLNQYCLDNDIIMQAWRPVQFGEIISKGGEILETLSKKYGKTYAQIVINWLISQENITTIAKMSTHEHITENLGALGWTMDVADIELLRKSYPNQTQEYYIPLK